MHPGAQPCSYPLILDCLLNETTEEIVRLLSLLFQTSIHQSKALTEWKHAHISPRVHDIAIALYYELIAISHL